MSTIATILTQDHKQCDDLFADVESEIVNKDWVNANKKFKEFSDKMEKHLSTEEELLFPEFEKKTGNMHGPTMVMKMEHTQIRDIINQIGAALGSETYDKIAGLLETLMILLQQHNMKEEQMLYPMTDQALTEEKSELVEKISQRLK